MDNHYKKLMNNKKSKIATVIDYIMLLILIFVFVLIFSFVNLGSLYAGIIIAMCICSIAFCLILKMHKMRFLSFKKELNEEIKKKILTEKIILTPYYKIKIKGYSQRFKNTFTNHKGELFIFISKYPTFKLDCDFILCQYKENPNLKGIIATCEFEEECFTLKERLNLSLLDLNFVIDNVDIQICEDEINSHIENEVKLLSQKKQEAKRNAFKKDKWLKYGLTALVLISMAYFMGSFSILYVIFACLCVSFSIISLTLSRIK